MFGFVGTVEEELQIGTTKMRLLVSKKGKHVVELWSSLSDTWRVTHREWDAYDQWLKWKATAENIKI
jgi:hypothetical protein